MFAGSSEGEGRRSKLKAQSSKEISTFKLQSALQFTSASSPDPVAPACIAPRPSLTGFLCYGRCREKKVPHKMMILSSMILSLPVDRFAPDNAADRIIEDKIILHWRFHRRRVAVGRRLSKPFG